MEVPKHIAEGLKSIDESMELRWNPQARYVAGSGFDAYGVIKDASYDGRWEVWARDDGGFGQWYRVMSVEGKGATFLPPGEWLLEHLRFHDPKRWGGSIEKMLAAVVDEPKEAKEKLSAAADRDMREYIANWWWKAAAPKSAPGRSYRGQTFRSAGADPRNLH